jgi:hypothetical protein
MTPSRLLTSQIIIRSTCLLILLLTTGLSQAEQKKTFGDYHVHYSVLNTTFITPENAKNYGITRSKNRALVNIAIRKRQRDGSSTAQRAMVIGTSSDLIHKSALEFNEVTEADAIYYIAELRFNDKELRSFDIKVQPDPNISAYTLRFSKTLYEQ